MIRLFFLFLTAFVADNLVVLFLPIQPIYMHYSVIPNILLTSLVLFTFYDRNNKVYFITIILGLLYDICYADLVGLYLFVFSVVIFLVRRYVTNLMPVNLLSVIGLMSLAITIKEWLVYFIVETMKGTNLTFFEFATSLLVPTVLVNILIVGICYPIFKSQFRQYERELDRF